MFMRGMIFPGGREPLLQGGGLYLRYPRSTDYAAWAAIREKSRDFLTPWEPAWPPDELTRGAFRRRIRRYNDEIKNDAAYPFFLFRQADNTLLGGCTVSNIRRGVCQSASVGYWIGGPYAHSGYMTGAMHLMIPFVFDTLALHRLEAACIPDNEPSRKLLLKLGFQEEGRARRYLQINGEWRDHILFSLLQDDPPVG